VRGVFYGEPMRIVVDTRDQRPWTFEGLGVSVIRKKLETGDYSVEGLERRVTIERKSIDDWVNTVLRNRKRFYRELERMRAFDFRCVIIEGGVREIVEGHYRSTVSAATLLGFVAEVSVVQSVPVYLAGSRAEAQTLAYSLLQMASKKISNLSSTNEQS
jgi:DNA excision repair protein ERCC-4